MRKNLKRGNRQIMVIDRAVVEEQIGAFTGDYERLRRQMPDGAAHMSLGKFSLGLPDDNEVGFNFGTDDFPEEALNDERFHQLIEIFRRIRSVLESPLPEAQDGREAFGIILRRHILALAQIYLMKVIAFLACDSRYHPENPVKVDAVDVLDDSQLSARISMMWFGIFLLSGINPGLPPASLVTNELLLLQHAADVFFDMCEIVFGFSSVLECRTSFRGLMLSMGTPQAQEMAAGYLRHHRTMYREIVQWRENGCSIGNDMVSQVCREMNSRMTEMQSSLDANTRAVANMSRRQREFIALIKRMLCGFIRLFRPSAPPLSHERVTRELDPSSRYDRLRNVKEPRRSQLKAVIDYTKHHPIVHKGRSKDDFTLANAARDVWNGNEARWRGKNGTYPDFDCFKAACYNLQENGPDPFFYKT